MVYDPTADFKRQTEILQQQLEEEEAESGRIGAAAQREYQPFVQSAARIKGRIHRLRTMPSSVFGASLAQHLSVHASRRCAENVIKPVVDTQELWNCSTVLTIRGAE